ncbi:MAG: hypothetical protein R6W81_12420 [Bacteroidales bacterium]
MHKEILSGAQAVLLPLVRQFKREFYLVGGTTIAIYIGHRAQLSYFWDINYIEPVEYLVPVPSEDEMRQFLIDKALDIKI